MVAVSVLGELGVVSGDGTTALVSATGPKRVLGQLAITAPGVAWTAALADTVWPLGPPPSYRSALRNTVTRLRRTLKDAACPEPILHLDSGYQLSNQVAIDAHQLERSVIASREMGDPEAVVACLTPALELWKGVPYRGFEGHPFESERHRLEQLRVEALETRQRALISVGRPQAGIHRLVAALADHQLHEGLVELLMVSHYHAGDQRKALELFHTTQGGLRSVLGLEPSPRLVALHQAILNHGEVVAPRERLGSDRKSTPARLLGSAVASSLTSSHGRLVSSSAERVSALMERGDSSAFLGHFNDAFDSYMAAVEEAQANEDVTIVGQLCLRLAAVTWEPDVASTVATLLDHTIAHVEDPVLGAELRICRAGGLYRSGVEGARPLDVDGLRQDLERVRRFGSAHQLGWATTRYRNALAGVISAADSLALTASIHDLSPVDPLLVGHNDRAIFADSLRADDRVAALHQRLAIEARGRDAEPAVNAFGRLTARNAWNLAIGRFAEVQRDLAESLSFRGQLGSYTLDQVIMGQSFWLTRELHDRAALESHLAAAQAFGAQDNATPLWAIAGALLATDLGELDVASEMVDEAHARFDLLALPEGTHRLPIQALTAEVLAVTARPTRQALAQALYTQLDAHSDHAVLAGWPTIFAGSKHRFLGFAACAAGDASLANEHLRRAVHDDRWMPPLKVRSLDALALVAPADEAQLLTQQAGFIRAGLFARMERLSSSRG